MLICYGYEITLACSSRQRWYALLSVHEDGAASNSIAFAHASCVLRRATAKLLLESR
jgi:hypothetical protein